jgi:L-ascorbate metabolism protein UlaG (beta-lactamase superfamily)
VLQITKYPQSCLALDKDDARILIDPGTFAFDAYSLDDFGDVQAVLFTHRHADHFDERHLDALLERDVEVFANADVCGLIGADRATVVRDGEAFSVAGFEVVARDLPHVVMVDGSPGPPNTGFVIDGTFFHPGDGIDAGGLRVDTLAVPIAGPSISFRDAYVFVQSVGARRAIPIHYDFFVADPKLFARFCDITEVTVLADAESVAV